MTAAPAGAGRPEQSGRPSLALVADCGPCGGRTVVVRDRYGKPVTLDATPDGKAVVDPDGVWWLVRVAGQWRVQQLAAGEDVPTSGGGRRHRAHQCPAQAEKVITAVFGPEGAPPPRWAGLTAVSGPCAGRCGRYVECRYGPRPDTMCPACRGVLDAWRMDPARGDLRFPPEPDGRDRGPGPGVARPVGRTRGLEGPACRERELLVQHLPPGSVTGSVTGSAMCARCGRVTERRDVTDGLAWCGGDFPTPPD